MSGISSYIKHSDINCQVIGAEVNTCDAMYQSINHNKIIEIDIKDNFIDGATVNKVGKLTFDICKKYLDDIYVSDVGKICNNILDLYQNDLSRYPEIIERNLKYKGLKQYYLIEFAQTSGQFKKFINNILKDSDDISRFEYIKKTNKEYGNVLVGIQVANKIDIVRIDNELEKNNLKFIKINNNDLLYSYLI